MNFLRNRAASTLCAGLFVAFLGTATEAWALTPQQTKAKIAQLNKRLHQLPRHKAPFPKILSLTNQLAKLDAKKSSGFLATGLSKIAMANAEKNAAKLTSSVNGIVGKAKISASLKKAIVKRNVALLKRWVPPRPPGPGPYQACRAARSAPVG